MPRMLMVTTVPVTLRCFLLPFADHFRAQGWRVDAMAHGISSCKECPQHFDHSWEVEWSRNPFDLRNLVKGPGRVAKLVAEQGYDLVHVHTPVAAFVTRFALRKLRCLDKVRVIYTAHGFHFYQGGSLWKNALFRSAEKVAGRWTDYLVVINVEDEQAARRYRLVPPDRVRYMPGIGVDTQTYHPAAIADHEVQRVRRELDLSPEDRLFLMVAEFIPRKRHRDALGAFAHLRRSNAVLALAGNGPLQPEMQRLAQDLGIADRVRFLGFRRDIAVLTRAAVATLLPSEQEGLPRSIMESLSLGVPAIGARIRGMADLLDSGAGLLTPVGDVPQLASALEWMLDHPEQARNMGDLGRRLMADYDLSRIIALHEDLYAEALATPGQQRPKGHPNRALSHPHAPMKPRS